MFVSVIKYSRKCSSSYFLIMSQDDTSIKVCLLDALHLEGITLHLEGIMHQSIPSTNIPPPPPPPRGIFFKVVKFPAPGQKIFAKLRSRGKK